MFIKMRKLIRDLSYTKSELIVDIARKDVEIVRLHEQIEFLIDERDAMQDEIYNLKHELTIQQNRGKVYEVD